MEINVVNIRKHKKTDHDFYIGRGKGSILGNPFTHIRDKKTLACYIVNSREEAMEKYKNEFLEQVVINKDFKREIDNMLIHLKVQGIVNLLCFCKPKECHGDVIKEYLLGRVKNAKCEHCYDTGWIDNGEYCICVRHWDR